MKFCIGPIDFELSVRFSSIRNKLKACYNNDITKRVDTIKLHRQLTGSSLLDAVTYCNEYIFLPEHRTPHYYENR